MTERDHAAAIEADVFRDVTDGSCGKTLITSVSRYLDRVEKLPRRYTAEPRASYAKKVREGLKSAGLTDGQVTWWRGQLATLLKEIPDIANRPDEL
ncbi:hypothetical protein [Sorangium sp. So ce1153]|uniref:hypothetical protein n=1 Tax=Sorangium sp. So ce1153 TaxID=3133333 RepID=UPI003F62AD1F